MRSNHRIRGAKHKHSLNLCANRRWTTLFTFTFLTAVFSLRLKKIAFSLIVIAFSLSYCNSTPLFPTHTQHFSLSQHFANLILLFLAAIQALHFLLYTPWRWNRLHFLTEKSLIISPKVSSCEMQTVPSISPLTAGFLHLSSFSLPSSRFFPIDPTLSWKN